MLLSLTLWQIDRQIKEQESQRLTDALKKAALNCYIMEGAYPDSADYLISRYGIIIDQDEYHVFYDVYASNMMPVIRVYRKG
ncbi:hypothetical protein SDC9_192447 [bioreactor metagenome]|uniref:Uncharacterized protein n=1 Tax=bioreactor metagenome TaxID=1076179 RepID=A0A645I153_9ZZZZ